MSTIQLIASRYPIQSVTIFKSSKAEVVRTFQIDLQEGNNKVEIEGLPSTIDTHSVRVSGLGEARLSDVVCTVEANKEASYAVGGSAEVIRLLRVKKQNLESEKRVREHEADLLVNYSKTLSGEHVPPSDMSTFLGTFVDQGRKNLFEIANINEKIVEVDRQIERETTKTTLKKGQSHGKVDISLWAEDPSSIELKLTYIVSNVSWSPTYELHATSENGKPSSSVRLHYRARVKQSTGEDWNGTALTLSTVASDNFIKKIPILHPVKLTGSASLFNRAFNNPNTGNIFNPNTRAQTNVNLFTNGSHGLFGTNPNLFGQSAVQAQGLPGNALSQVVPQQTQQSAGSSQQPSTDGLFGSSVRQFQQPATTGGGIFGTAVQSQLTTTQATNSAPTFGFSSFGSGGAPSVPQPQVLPAASRGVQAESEADFEEIVAPGSATEPTTFVTETPIAISYSIHGESTIPSDAIEHQVSVAILPFDSNISYVAIPRLDPRVYLQCEVKNTSDYRLLAGPVTVILDDSFVSKAYINDVNMGDNFDCTLGDDPATKVTYSRVVKTVKDDVGSFAEAKNTSTYTTKVTIFNKHAFPIPNLVVKDAIPTSDDKRAKVILRRPNGLADAKDGEEVMVNKELGLKVGWEKLVDGKGGEKDGKFEWKGSIKAKDKIVLEAKWEIKGPADTWYSEIYSGN